MTLRKKHFPKKSFGEKKGGGASLGFGKGKIIFGEKRILIEGSEEAQYYVFPTRSEGFVHGDFVEYEITRPPQGSKLAEARPLRLIKRSQEELLMRTHVIQGKITYRIIGSLGELMVRCESNPLAPKDGDMHVVKFRDTKIVQILRYFGYEKDPHIMEEIIFFRAHTRRIWPEEFKDIIIAEIPKLPPYQESESAEYLHAEKALPSNLKLTDIGLFPIREIQGTNRYDFRLWPTLTIDGADAKDLDDALSIIKFENNDFLLGVHIADVAEYVEEGSALDREAYLRGTSIYTPGRVIPMLPEILSNDRCSLHPGSPKLTLSLLIRVNPLGQVREVSVCEGIIESQRKGIYEEIAEEIEKTPEKNLKNLYELYKILEKRRKSEGKILFEMTECYYELDDERGVKNIKKRVRNEAHMMIEECMVLANEEIAKWCATKKIPFLSRVHSAPSTEKGKEIREIITLSRKDRTIGMIQLGEGSDEESSDITPHQIRSILENAQAYGDVYRLSRLLLPKMAKALYKESIDRHFGLALKYYAHFTSPIRRYPDLLLHRMIKKHLRGELAKTQSIYEKSMKKWGQSLSEKERAAEEVSRAIDSLYMCQYMSDKVGQSFLGIISGLTESNVYVELESGVEGSIFFGKEKTSYTLDPLRGALKDSKGKEVYRIGKPLQIKIREVDMINRRIEMELS